MASDLRKILSLEKCINYVAKLGQFNVLNGWLKIIRFMLLA
jgi:hypothetical protein